MLGSELEDWLKDPESSPPPAQFVRDTSSLSDLWVPEHNAPARQSTDLGELLLDQTRITPGQLSQARQLQTKNPNTPLADILYEMGLDEDVLQRAVATLSGLPYEEIEDDNLEGSRYLQKLGVDFCRERMVLPLRATGTRLTLGVVHPDDMVMLEEVRMRIGMPVKPVIVRRSAINAILEKLREESTPEVAMSVDEIVADIDEDDVEVVQQDKEELDLEKMAGESPVIRLVNYIIFTAVKEGASDIHIEPGEKKLKVRYRIDGVLFESMSPPHPMHPAIISRLKIMANLDISERRLPQDGRIRAMIHGRKLDLRLSTLPTAYGEKAVMRILDTRSISVPLDELGMNEDELLMWKRQIDQPHGIILVTGPTGSGKTTTLYASLGQMDRTSLNISTVEDPVEYNLSGITQTQTHESIGMSFAAALKSLLRQDPDVIMVGEIRDKETATIAIQASLTGHLVLSTLHTNDAPSSITRLINIGVEPYLIATAVNACLAQRLVRRICQHCATQVPPDEVIAEHLSMHGVAIDQIWKGAGCDRCRNTGYTGRVGLYELLVMDDRLRDRVASNPNVTEFRRICIERGMKTLREDGFYKVGQGRTTVDEVLRVTEATI
ncbi:MAG: Flp pilus assembly complex ATPase component TadA [Phycisphaeraceae bacterium]|nr:Flp pilus assembly complex ATPase component TadA [Phycisphaeraceae bacterium]